MPVANHSPHDSLSHSLFMASPWGPGGGGGMGTIDHLSIKTGEQTTKHGCLHNEDWETTAATACGTRSPTHTALHADTRAAVSANRLRDQCKMGPLKIVSGSEVNVVCNIGQ